MKFAVSLTMERFSPDVPMSRVKNNLLELARMADQGGFEALWTAEHHTIECTISPNPFQTLVWLAQHTEQIRLGTSTLVAPYWTPIRLAGESALCDHLTNGRLEFGIARGSYQYEFDRMAGGMPQQEGVAYMKEIVPAVKKLWAGDYAHDGHYWKFPVATSVPKPLQQPNPPIWVAARDPNSHEFAVANGCNVQVTPLWQGDDEVEALIGRFNDACAKSPHMERPKIMLLRHTYVGSSEDDIARAAHELSVYYNYFFAWFKNEKPIHQGLIERIPEEDIRANAMLSDAVMRGNNVVGDASTVIARLKTYKAMGYDEYSFWIDTGMSFERKKASLERFIAEVMPAFAE